MTVGLGNKPGGENMQVSESVSKKKHAFDDPLPSHLGVRVGKSYVVNYHKILWEIHNLRLLATCFGPSPQTECHCYYN